MQSLGTLDLAVHTVGKPSLLTSWGLVSAHCQMTVLPAGIVVTPFWEGTCHCMVVAPAAGALAAARAERGASAALGPGAGAGARAGTAVAAARRVRPADAPQARQRAAMAKNSRVACADRIVSFAGQLWCRGVQCTANGTSFGSKARGHKPAGS